jgi:hypothetical protein
MEMTEMMDQLSAGIARLAQAAEALEGSAGRMTAEAGGSVSKITAARRAASTAGRRARQSCSGAWTRRWVT